MADEPKLITELTAGGAPVLTDLMIVGQDPGGTLALVKQELTSIRNLFVGAPTAAGDFPVSIDTSGAYVKRTLAQTQAILGIGSGWVSGITWTYASATTFTIVGDYSAVLTKGMKFKLTANSVVLQGYILSAVYSSPNTTVTVIGDALTSHTFTENYYSTAANPAGFPTYFNYTPTGTNIGGTGLAYSGVFNINGGVAYVKINVTGTNTTSTNGVSTLSMPTGLAAASSCTCTATNSFVANLGCGLVSTNIVFPPAWGAADNVYISTTFVI
jgi:hypothetical protein